MSPSDDDYTPGEIRRELQRIETALEELATLEALRHLETRVDDLEADQVWGMRIALGAVITGLVGLVFFLAQQGLTA